MVYSRRKVPHRVVTKADEILSKFNAREIFAVKHYSGRGESLRVGKDWRLYRQDSKREFELMSHETYNKIKDQR